ncbi:hypothetical protein [Ottowia sp.]|uniref:hypothetical protein n=1 Tax=Ottowia sp. TaxID=1898956 RepID=UPI002616117E|nr:hypothetical protein [Ottowia sp.]
MHTPPIPGKPRHASRRRIRRAVFGAMVLGLSMLAPQQALAATVAGVFGSFGSYWTSSTSAISAVQPNDSNLLLGFTVGSNTFSTGVDDAALTANGVTFSPQVFHALPMPAVATPSTTGTNVIGIASNWGGVNQAAAYPGGDVPTNAGRPMSYYLDDGTQGLELGTAVFNIPATTNSATAGVSGVQINPASIGDGVPDILVTQVGQPGTSDTFGFYDAGGNPVGTLLPVNFSGVPVVGRQQWTFYDAVTRASFFSLNGSRDLRLIALDYADLGITAANYNQIAEFRQNLSGASDIAFIAYNATSVPVVLPELALTKSSGTLAVGSTGTYTLALANQSTQAATSGSITVTDTLPTGLVPTAATGTGWTCTITGQAVSCNYVASIAAGASAPPITVGVSVGASAAAVVINTATASGGGDTACPAAARCTGTVASPVAGGVQTAVPTLGLPGLLLTGLGVGILGWLRRRRA